MAAQGAVTLGDAEQQPHQLEPPHGTFLVVLDDDGAAVACAGIRRHSDRAAELKRMWVDPAARGRGYARALLGALEAAAGELGYTELVLETGLRQPEAMALYESAGFEPIENFGYYRDSPLSRCFRKEL